MAPRSFWQRSGIRIYEAMHCWLGGYYQRRGNLPSAQDEYLKVLERFDQSFRAHLNLGRIYLRQGHIARARDELHRARDLDPHRFAREGFPGDPLLWIADRLPEARLHKNLIPEANGSSCLSAEVGPVDGFDPSRDVVDLPFGDFSGRDEAQRFSLLPPISYSETFDIDWEKLGHELMEGE